jgi:DNA-binding NarL/FixJ family response regulator
VTAAPTLVLAEDNLLLRQSLAAVLERFGYSVVAQVADGPGLLAAVAEHRPQVVLTDVRMPPTFTDEGVRAAIEIRRRRPGLPVLVLSQYVTQPYAQDLLADGDVGVGYLLKDNVTDIRALDAALREIRGGGTVIDREVIRHLLRRHPAPLSRLTDRERETLALMAQGRSNTAIADALAVAEATVAKHIRNIFDKLELAPAATDHRRVLAVVTYLQQGADG